MDPKWLDARLRLAKAIIERHELRDDQDTYRHTLESAEIEMDNKRGRTGHLEGAVVPSALERSPGAGAIVQWFI